MSKADEYNNEMKERMHEIEWIYLVLRQLRFGNPLQSDLSMIILPILLYFGLPFDF